MDNEQTKKIDTQGKEVDKSNEEAKPLSIVDEARAIRDEIKKQKEEIIEERKKLETVQSEELLGSSAGGHIEATPAKEETAKEYADKVMKNEVKE